MAKLFFGVLRFLPAPGTGTETHQARADEEQGPGFWDRSAWHFVAPCADSDPFETDGEELLSSTARVAGKRIFEESLIQRIKHASRQREGECLGPANANPTIRASTAQPTIADAHADVEVPERRSANPIAEA